MPSSLNRIPLPALRTLLREVELGHMSPPFTGAALMATGLAHLAEEIGLLQTFDAPSLCTLLETVIVERERAEKPRFDLVWTGPEARISPSRDTSVVVREMFGAARSTVFIGGYSFSEGQEIFAPLHHVMTQHGVKTDLFMNIEGSWEKRQKQSAEELEARVNVAVETFLIKNWPFGEPQPTIYYAPLTATPFSRASLHAKCLVIDEKETLVTSANFTERGQTRNIEVGVLVSDRAFARRLLSQWWGLLSAGFVERHRP